MIGQFSKKLQLVPVPILPKLTSVLIHAHLCCSQQKELASLNLDITTRGVRSHLDSDYAPVPKFLNPVSSEISDFTPCTHAQSNILQTKYADKTHY